MIVGTQCTNGRALNTDSDWDWRWSHKTLLDGYGAESWENSHVKVIENFETFSGGANTPSSDKQFRSYGQWKLGVLPEISGFWTDQLSAQIWTLSLYPKEIWKKSKYGVLENFITFLMMGRTQDFNLEWRNYDRLKLNGLVRYDFFHFGLTSSFFWFVFQSSNYSCKCIWKIMTYGGPIRSLPKETICQIYMAYV
jgi:hypothetical protein